MTMLNSSTNAPRSQDTIEVVLASGNAGKLRELRDLLGPSFRVQSARDVQAELPEETGSTFAENAILKANSVASQTGLIAISDDSGLEVDALDGAPGVHTARYAGDHATDEQNRVKLLDALKDVPPARRGARFVSVIAIAFDPDDVVTAEGICEGEIATRERGDGGFGYDSLFLVPSGKTMAELSFEQKNAISHRGQAMKKAMRLLIDRTDASRKKGAGR